MAGIIELRGTIRVHSHRAAEWTAANPVLAADEPARERDTGRWKVGDGLTPWNELPYFADPSSTLPPPPSLRWKVCDWKLFVSPNTLPDDPALAGCYVGILRYKKANQRTITPGVTRPESKAYRLVQDMHADPGDLAWSRIRINPIPLDPNLLKAYKGWQPVIDVSDLCHRFIEVRNDPEFARSERFVIHRGQRLRTIHYGPGYDGLNRQKASVLGGVVLLRKNSAAPGGRVEGPRSFFRICLSNYTIPGWWIEPMV